MGEKAIPAPPVPVWMPTPAPVPVPPPRVAPAAVVPADSPTGKLIVIGPDGTELALNARLVLGRTVLMTKFGEGGKFAADQQFILDKKDDGWFVEPVAGTLNATLLNGDVLTARAKLTPGAVIGIGNAISKRSKLDMQVKVG